MALATGSRIGAYEILAPLGAGGMGEVYRARHHQLDREVAVKVLPSRLLGDEGAQKRFAREAKMLATLSHPNILAIYDFVTEGDQYCVVAELLEGETLRSAALGAASCSGAGRPRSARPSRRAWPRRTRRASSTAT